LSARSLRSLVSISASSFSGLPRRASRDRSDGVPGPGQEQIAEMLKAEAAGRSVLKAKPEGRSVLTSREAAC
jgi:hypothetical protein